MTAHALLHVNLNTPDVAATEAFYADRFGLTVGMRTAPEPVDGALLGLSGETRSDVRFLYDARGPRTAPAIEALQWFQPLPTGAVPVPDRLGIAALGFEAAEPDSSLTDPHGVAVEVRHADVDAPHLAYLRVNVSDADRSGAWYARVGFDGGISNARLELTEVAAGEPPIGPANHLGMYRMALGVDDVAASVRALGVDVTPIWCPLPGTKLGGLTVAFLTDPDGTTVELVERPRSAMR